jgi:hypothetical protein
MVRAFFGCASFAGGLESKGPNRDMMQIRIAGKQIEMRRLKNHHVCGRQIPAVRA